jgi:xanthine dehydrogenase accessory factor
MTTIAILSAIKSSLTEGRALAIVSQLEAGPEKLLVEDSGNLVGGTLGDRGLNEAAARYALQLMADDRTEITVAPVSQILDSFVENIKVDEPLRQARLLFEISRPALEMIICGGGHVGQAVAKAARLLDLKVTVIDDRADFASREKFPDPEVQVIAADFTAALQSLKITPASHLVIVTRGHRHDEICLREVIDKPARYIGMIGSRRRTTTIRERLRKEGVTAELLRRVHAPIGLDIGAQTPEEIALAILAEVVLTRRGGTGTPKSQDGPMAKAR